MEQINVLSIKYPWSLFIVYGGQLAKDLENRQWRYPPKYRGRLYIHCGLEPETRDLERCLPRGIGVDQMIAEIKRTATAAGWPTMAPDDLLGKVIGYVDLVDVVTASASPWWIDQPGNLGFVLANPAPVYPAVALRGKLGIFKADAVAVAVT